MLSASGQTMVSRARAHVIDIEGPSLPFTGSFAIATRRSSESRRPRHGVSGSGARMYVRAHVRRREGVFEAEPECSLL